MPETTKYEPEIDVHLVDLIIADLGLTVDRVFLMCDYRPIPGLFPCAMCEGNGYERGDTQSHTPCPACKGRGKVSFAELAAQEEAIEREWEAKS